MKIKQQWIPYWEWEDWINGMWRTITDKYEESKMIETAIIFTGDHIQYGSAMKEVVVAWPRTMLNSLTNPSINKRAFVGRCAVCYKLNIPEYVTRIAWKQLNDEQRFLADELAQKTVDEWRSKLMLTY